MTAHQVIQTGVSYKRTIVKLQHLQILTGTRGHAQVTEIKEYYQIWQLSYEQGVRKSTAIYCLQNSKLQF